MICNFPRVMLRFNLLILKIASASCWRWKENLIPKQMKVHNRILMKHYLFILFFLSRAFFLDAQDTIILRSGFIPAPDTVLVYLPDGIPDSIKKPAVYLLHGLGGYYGSWSEKTDLQLLANKYGFAVICPDGFVNSYYLNSPIKKEWQFESFFVLDLYPFMLKKYNLDRKNIFISGLSMGGHGACLLYLGHQGLFRSGASSSGVMDLTGATKSRVLRILLGDIEKHPERFRQVSAVHLAKNIRNTPKEIFFDCGTDDNLYQQNLKMKHVCDSLGVKYTFLSQTGGHQVSYWQKTIEIHFLYFRQFVDGIR